MAHTKAQGAANRTVNVEGKRLGIKRYAGEKVNAGTIILRQKGTKFHPGLNAKMGRDYTIFASIDGIVSFRAMTGFHRGQKYVDIKTAKEKKPAVKAKVAAKKATPKKAAATKTVTKATKVAKPATKKAN